jgi:hypothetical protein
MENKSFGQNRMGSYLSRGKARPNLKDRCAKEEEK